MARNPIGIPHVVNASPDGSASSTRKIAKHPLEAGRSEAWLQQLLHDHPELLPVNLVDERLQEPLTPIALEVATAAGYIDNLLISSNGHPVIVETKLWRNPEARRKVVVQLLDYAAQVRSWSYQNLEDVWRKYHKSKDSLWSFVKTPDYDNEADWIDLVGENLRLGRFALLIVGDGIRDEARQLAGVLSGRPDFQFRLGFIELRLYDLTESEILVIPSCIARTIEIERAVVRIEHSDAAGRAVSVEMPAETDSSSRAKSSVLNRQAFLDLLRRDAKIGTTEVEVAETLMELLEESNLILDWQSASVSLIYPDPDDSGIMFSLGTIYKNGKVGCWTSILAQQLSKAISDSKSAKQIHESHLRRARDLGITGDKDIGVNLSELSGREHEVVEWLDETVRMIHKAADKHTVGD